jgi:hypothetical protein
MEPTPTVPHGPICSMAPPTSPARAPGPPRQSVVDTWDPRANVGPASPEREGGVAVAEPLRLNKTKGFYITAQRRRASRSPTQPPPPPPPSSSAVPPPRPCSPRLGISSERRRSISSGGGGERERHLGPPAAAFEEGRRRHWLREGGRHWIDRSFWIRIQTQRCPPPEVAAAAASAWLVTLR